MNFTPKLSEPLVRGILTIAVVGLILWAGSMASGPTPMATTARDGLAPTVSLQPSDNQPSDNAPAVEPVSPGFPTAGPAYYQPISAWYKSKHWWKRNAPIVGGAGGGALIGGLAGGGKGALIGGAIGGGGGYLYKRTRHHHYHH
jgi:hypothetical protein